MIAPDLLTPLLILSSNATMREKNEAARALDDAVHARFGRRLAKVCEGCFDDAVQHLHQQAIRRMFHGRSPGEAYQWCDLVLRRFCISDRRKVARANLDVPPDLEATGDLGASERVLRTGQRAIEKLRSQVKAASRAPTAETQIDCFLHRRTGGGIEEALERWGGAPAAQDAAARTKAATRIYNYRRKGEALARTAFAALTANGALDDAEQRFLTALLSSTEDDADGTGSAPS